MWLACKIQDEIAHIVDKDRSVIARIVQKCKAAEMHNLSNNPPESLKLFNLWNFADSGSTIKYPGQIPAGVIENLLWYFTKPFDVVYDPFAGSGTTIRVCKEMMRRWQACGS